MDLANIKAGIAAVRKALGKTGSSEMFRHYLIKDGYIIASDGNLTAGVPVNWPDADFLINSEDLEAVINRLPSDPVMEKDENKIVLKAGRSRMTLLTLPPDGFSYLEADFSDPLDLDDKFHYYLKKLSGYIPAGDDGSWYTAVNILDGLMLSTNRGHVLAAADYPPLKGVTAVLPRRTVDLLCGWDPPLHFEFSTGGSTVLFDFPGGGWVRTSLLTSMPMDKVAKLMGQITRPEEPMSPEWKEAFLRVCALSEEDVFIYADRITGEGGKHFVEEHIPSPVRPGTNCSRWNPKLIAHAVEMATHWDPSAYPNPSTFWCSDGIRGLISGKVV